MQEADLRHFAKEKLACFDHIRALMTVDEDSLLGCQDFKPKPDGARGELELSRW